MRTSSSCRTWSSIDSRDTESLISTRLKPWPRTSIEPRSDGAEAGPTPPIDGFCQMGVTLQQQQTMASFYQIAASHLTNREDLLDVSTAGLSVPLRTAPLAF